MHDPMTVAFEIKSPFKRKSIHFPEGYRSALVTIWHVDPEKDGTDNSCGWSYVRLTNHQRTMLKSLAWTEARTPWFQRLRAKQIEDPILGESLMRAAILQVGRALDLTVEWSEACTLASRFIHGSDEHFRGGLCHLPGWHTNFPEDTRSGREDTAMGLFSGIALHLLTARRPWYRHPRWHIHHWKIQIHHYQTFLRWAFTRCSKCGGRFKWGQTGVGTWDSEGPRWFRSENLIHMNCDRNSPQAIGATEQEATS